MLWINGYILLFAIASLISIIITDNSNIIPIVEKELYNVENKNRLNTVSVYLNEEKIIENISLENYVRSVLISEMPIDFEFEALKAQAIVARTYVIEKITNNTKNDAYMGADVTDTIKHQAYLSKSKFSDRWELKNKNDKEKIDRVISETEGLVIHYKEKPIHAAYFSTSNGYTENSEDYWSDTLPYLRSVESPWDRSNSPKYKSIKKFNITELTQKLNVKEISTNSEDKFGIKIIKKSSGNRIISIKIGGKEFSARNIREILQLASTDFEWKWDNDQLTITNYGYGHGIGLSQYGANGMAKEGKNATEIISYYYKGVTIKRM